MAKRNRLAKGFNVNPEKAKIIEALQDDDVDVDDEPRRKGRRKRIKEPTTRFNAQIPSSLYDAFYEAVEEHGGGNMSRVVIEFMQDYIDTQGNTLNK